MAAKRTQRKPSVASDVAACTIISRNYLAHARVLAESFRQHHRRGRFYVLVVDHLPDGLDLADEFQLIKPEDLSLPYFYELCFKYDVTELCTAVKPTLLAHIFEHYGESRLAYLDPDIIVMRPLTDVWQALTHSEIVLTPHLLEPIPDDGQRPSEQDILKSGAYNLGFIGLRHSDGCQRFLQWWQERLRDGCRIDLANGLFTDQKWIDLVPGLFSPTTILRDETYNVAYWNYHSRPLTHSGDTFSVHGQPLAFFHFSGFNHRTPKNFSKHQTRNKVVRGKSLARLLSIYTELLLKKDALAASQWSYGYSHFDNGAPVNSILRQLYLSLPKATAATFGDPFLTTHTPNFLSWATTAEMPEDLSPFLQGVYRSRYDVAAAFPDVRGRDRDGFVNWAETRGWTEMGYDPIWAKPAAAKSTIATASGNGQSEHAPASAAFATPSTSPAPTDQSSHRERYEALKYRLRRVVEQVLPQDCNVLVISKGDPELIDLPARHGRHFPQAPDGTYPGYYPSDSQMAIGHLDALRQQGAHYLIVPTTASWWLDHYREFRAHLECNHSLVHSDQETGQIYALNCGPAVKRSGGHACDAVETVSHLPFGVNLAGYFTSEKGVGEAVRADVRCLQAEQIPFVMNPLRADGSAEREGGELHFSTENPYRVNLIHVNADQAVAFAAAQGADYFRGRYNIGFWAWELADFPQRWMSSFELFDEIWVPSNFVLDSVARRSPIPVVRIPHSLPESPITANKTRRDFHIPAAAFVCLFVFDCHSYIARKNPHGLIEAYRRAFGTRTDTLLILKCGHATAAELAELRQASADANIRIVDDVLSRGELNDLIRAADCYVSLHRSEGFGLTMAEAMNLGKPVIATGYSSNLDFMTPSHAWLVRYDLVELTDDHGPYQRGRQWANPDLDHAAQLLRAAAENRDELLTMGLRGQQHVANLLHPQSVGQLMRARLSLIDVQIAARNAAAARPRLIADDAFDAAAVYRRQVDRVRQMIAQDIPEDASVLVVSKGDEELLDVEHRRMGHFPQSESGEYAGFYPSDSLEAIRHLNQLGAAGANYLVFPAAALWWLEHYQQFRVLLESQHRCVRSDADGALFELIPNADFEVIRLSQAVASLTGNLAAAHCAAELSQSEVAQSVLALLEATRALQQRADQLEVGLSQAKAQLGAHAAQFVSETQDRNTALTLTANRVRFLGEKFESVGQGLQRVEEQQTLLTACCQSLDGHPERLARTEQAVAAIHAQLTARPYMARDVFGALGELTKPMGYATDAACLTSDSPISDDFIDIFRGPESFIAERQRGYLPMLRGCENVVDLGCGRGEFLQLLSAEGISATGVDADLAMIRRLQAKGLAVVQSDGLEYLRGQAAGSLGAIFSAQFVEHLSLEHLKELLTLAKTRLRRGGIFIAETVNPESFQALKVFHVDLTHQRPIFPQVLLAMCQWAGFASARVFYPCGGGFTQTAYQSAGEYAVVAIA